MPDKDIFEQFRQAAEELEQQPTPPTWSRIERRIQSQRPGVRRATPKVRRLPSVMSIAAALALVMGLALTFLWLTQTQLNKKDALLASNTSLEIEELQLIPAEAAPPIVAMAHNTPQTAPTKPIVEGTPQQRLVAKTDTRTPTTPPSRSTPDSIRRDRVGR